MKNRELKFRVWDNQQKKFGCFELHNICVSDRLLCQHSYPVQQFTGILDKNGKEVYEGDIIQWFRMLEATIEYPAHRAQYRSIVEYEDGKFGFVMNGFNGLFQTLCDEYDIEIIGNIFENEP